MSVIADKLWTLDDLERRWQPYGFSTTIECNRCGAQCEGGAEAA